MAKTTIEYFRQVASEFANLDDATVTGWIDTAAVYIVTTLIETEKSKLSQALYAAHLCWLNKYPGSGGASRGNILKEVDGNLSREYRAIVGSDNPLGQSYYGMEYLILNPASNTMLHKPSILTRFGT